MLTRLAVSGFKNLVDVDVSFGPFTCIAGANGVGKSNLFDAIGFLSGLADRPLLDAALSVRDEGRGAADVRSIFHRVGDTHDREMSLHVEFIIPQEGVDDLGQQVSAAITFLEYELVLGSRYDEIVSPGGPLEIRREILRHIPLGQAHARLRFPHAARKWRKTAVTGRRSAPYFISTESARSGAVIRVHSDSGSLSGGRPLSRAAANLPRTVLSAANAAENRTAFLAKKEMESWRLLQLEPSALRTPDEFTAPTRIGLDGSHLPATLFRLANRPSELGPEAVYADVANRLAELISEIQEVRVNRDERRELLTLEVVDNAQTPHAARSLSDGTLRFLALAVQELEPEGTGVICLEEPENGIHPVRIPAMLRLLQDIALDPFEPVGPDNPLRQVIVNTHSPAVVANVPDESLLVGELKELVHKGSRFDGAVFSPLADTWRSSGSNSPSPVSRGHLLSYLNPFALSSDGAPSTGRKTRRVVDRPDLQLLLPSDPNDQDG